MVLDAPGQALRADLVLGHQIVGVVQARGPGVDTPSPGLDVEGSA